MNSVELIRGVTESIVYSVLGIVIMISCFFIVGKMTNFSLKKELIEDENIALGIMFAGFFVSVAIIIAAAIYG